jgi:small subunit ribosomal protein S4e
MTWIKRLAAPRHWPIERKTSKFVVTSRGPHSFGIPLLVIIRDVLGYADTGKEAKKIITSGQVLVDGKKCKDIKFGIGLMDVVEIPAMSKSWRMLPLKLKETSETKTKLCKIVDKKILRGNKLQLNLHDGRNIIADNSYKTRDSILIELPDQKIKHHLKFQKGMLALILIGKRAGEISEIEKIETDRVWLKNGEIPIDGIMIVGKEKPMIHMGE